MMDPLKNQQTVREAPPKRTPVSSRVQYDIKAWHGTNLANIFETALQSCTVVVQVSYVGKLYKK